MLRRLFPFLRQTGDISAATLRADLVSGVTVALVLIPQSMAYAQLAGLPAYYGLYAAFLPPTVAALFGSSRQLATGPVAIVSLMTAATLEPLATAGSQSFIAYAILLSLIVGLFQLALGVFRLGVIVNFLSHPVVTGFVNAGAIIIASSQLGKLFGVEVESRPHFYETVFQTLRAGFTDPHLPTLAFGAGALAVMLFLRRISRRTPNVLVAVAAAILLSATLGFDCRTTTSIDEIRSAKARTEVLALNASTDAVSSCALEGRRLDRILAEVDHGAAEGEAVRHEIALNDLRRREAQTARAEHRRRLRGLRLVGARRSGGNLVFFEKGAKISEGEADHRVWRLSVSNGKIDPDHVKLSSGGAVVGTIPRGLPALGVPRIDFHVALTLIPSAIVIALLGFMEAISIAKAMAARSGQRLSPNQELIGQGLACLVGSFSGSYPVSGSFSRSAVNFQVGAVTGLSSIFSSVVVAVTLLFLTPLLFHLPQAVLAAVIMMAVVGLVKPRTFVHAFRVHWHDGLVAVTTFVATLAFAPHLERGIAIGVVLSLSFYLMRNMKPQVAVLSRHPDGSFRNAARWSLAECEHVSVIRFNGSLVFANATYLEDEVLERVAGMPHLRYVLIVGNGINEIDSSGEDVLTLLVGRLRDAGFEVGISGLNDAAVDLLKRTHLYEKIGERNLFRSVNDALRSIHAGAHEESSEVVCPLLRVVRMGKDLKGPGSASGAYDDTSVVARSPDPG